MQNKEKQIQGGQVSLNLQYKLTFETKSFMGCFSFKIFIFYYYGSKKINVKKGKILSKYTKIYNGTDFSVLSKHFNPKLPKNS